MFTGIVQARARVAAIERGEHLHRLTIAFPSGFCADLQRGASIAIDGVCLTVTEQPRADHVCFDVMAATLARTTLAALASEQERQPPTACDAPTGLLRPTSSKAVLGRGQRSEVNAERAARQGAEIGGHVVSGHVDCTAQVVAVERGGAGRCQLTFAVPREFAPYAFARGFVAIDGASLTIVAADRAAGTFSVSLIPETLAATTLGQRVVGDAVNIEWERTTVAIVDTLREAVGGIVENTLQNAIQNTLQNALRDFVLTQKGK